MRVALHQPNYAPWCGYFAKMKACDVFIFLDDVQMPSGRSFVYRCAIQSNEGQQWLSVPTHFRAGDAINAVQFADESWTRKHMRTLHSIYGRCPFFSEIFSLIEPIYQSPGDSLSSFNIKLIRTLANYLNMSCRFEASSALQHTGRGDDRLIELVNLTGGTTYISGKGGQNYQDVDKFIAAGLQLEVHGYIAIPYLQKQNNFVPGLSILDAIFNLGPNIENILHYPLLETNPDFEVD